MAKRYSYKKSESRMGAEVCPIGWTANWAEAASQTKMAPGMFLFWSGPYR